MVSLPHVPRFERATAGDQRDRPAQGKRFGHPKTAITRPADLPTSADTLRYQREPGHGRSARTSTVNNRIPLKPSPAAVRRHHMPTPARHHHRPALRHVRTSSGDGGEQRVQGDARSGAPDPVLVSLAAKYRAARMVRVAHPSEPNYVGFVSGGDPELVGDHPYRADSVAATTSLGGQLTAQGVPWVG